MRKIAILGATGSIGTSVLSVIAQNPGEFEVTGLAACRPSEDMIKLAGQYPEAMVALATVPDAAFRQRLEAAGCRGGLLTGGDAAARLASEVDAEMCVAAISGTAGLAGAFAAARRGMTMLIANKEVLVSAGRLFMKLASVSGLTVLPLDSEHAALWQCLYGRDAASVARVTITASGGPFWHWQASEMAAARVEDALKHPVWSMGAKISIDSATMANKALEVIEARALFGFSEVEILVHPQSVVHGMVEFTDGSVIAHMGVNDMRQPINHMLFYPNLTRAQWKGGRLNLAERGTLEFFDPDYKRFPLLRMGLKAGIEGGLFPAYFNVANEEAVDAFLRRGIGFGDIASIVGKVMDKAPAGTTAANLDDVLAAHEEARTYAREAIAETVARVLTSVSSLPLPPRSS